ncbi:MAG TPA: hypothetical protein VLA17_08910, partial [Candidatus Limnocylindria bacterium]|nr:hypothetical protein [Candidatus Limnocylindria bacterium]
MIYALPNIRIAEKFSRNYLSEKLRQLESPLELLPKQELAVAICRGEEISAVQKRAANLGIGFEPDFKIYLNANTKEILKEEHKKAVKEIDRRTQIDDFWFNNKFILVGALFAAFIAYFSPLFNPSVAKEQPKKAIIKPPVAEEQ